MASDDQSYLSWLSEYQHSDGGVAYLKDRRPRVEPTALSILAGAGRPEDLLWLQSQLPPELLLKPVQVGDRQDVALEAITRPWLVAMGVLALSSNRSQSALLDVAACADYLRKNHTADVVGIVNENAMPTLTGALPWRFGNYGWVEPTCWGLLAELAMLNVKNSDEDLLLASVELRLLYLMSIKTRDHGWNYGDTHVLDAVLPAHPQQTAMVLTALGGVNNFAAAKSLLPQKFEADSSFERLDQLQQIEGSRLTRAWQRIAERVWNRIPVQDIDVTVETPSTGESSVDALVSVISNLSGSQQGFGFLQRASS